MKTNKIDLLRDIGETEHLKYKFINKYKFKSYNHKRTFDLTAFEKLGAFTEVVTRTLAETSLKYSEGSSPAFFQPILNFLSFLIKQAEASAELQQKLTMMDAATVNEMVRLWGSDLKNQNLKDSTKNNYIHMINSLIESIEHSEHTGSLNRIASIKNPVDEARDNFHDTIRKHIHRISEEYIENLTHSERLILDSFRSNLGSENYYNVKEKIETVLQIIRKNAELTARNIINEFFHTKHRIYKNVDFETSRFESSYKLQNGKWRRGWQYILRNEDNMLKYINQKTNGIIDEILLDKYVYKFICTYYGVKYLRDKLHMTTDNCISFVLIIALETNLNISSILNLKSDCCVGTLSESEIGLKYTKFRSSNEEKLMHLQITDDRAINIDSTKRLTADLAIQCISELREPIVAYAPPEYKDDLFLVWKAKSTYKSEQKDPNCSTLTNVLLIDTWNRFRSNVGILSAFPFTVSQIRNSIAYCEYVSSGFNVFHVQNILDHKSISTTERYIKSNINFAQNVNFIRNALEYFALGISGGKNEIIEYFELDEIKISYLINSAENVGFLKWTQVNRDNGESISNGNSFSDLLLYSNFIIIEDIYIVAEMISMKEHINLQKQYIGNLPCWSQRWAPLMCLITEALRRVSPSIIVKARKLISDLDIQYGELL